MSRVVIASLPRSKHLLISWLQSLSAVILQPKKMKSNQSLIELYLTQIQNILKIYVGIFIQLVSLLTLQLEEYSQNKRQSDCFKIQIRLWHSVPNLSLLSHLTKNINLKYLQWFQIIQSLTPAILQLSFSPTYFAPVILTSSSFFCLFVCFVFNAKKLPVSGPLDLLLPRPNIERISPSFPPNYIILTRLSLVNLY